MLVLVVVLVLDFLRPRKGILYGRKCATGARSPSGFFCIPAAPPPEEEIDDEDEDDDEDE